ncbi:MAG TPA: UDP-N-acetylglucosamine 2-epimerase [Holophaga sp.]|jgi:UDP-N-acetylglucosamine 2-epimerase (non-hydrolysing)/GDP/UDP-N,N'-diacetylbacillosamine 2-epimerase (hydrolysing)|nr:UDP-N-acetylglucosamine 2-epimerase [Holophaga sp.]
MRRIGVVTVARSDYGIYRSILRAIENDPGLELSLYVTGMHLAPEFGSTVRDIERDGYHIAERIEMLLSSDAPEGISKSMGIGVMGFAQAFGRQRPDLLLVLGDRFEMIAAALAALPFNLPVAHIHGGEVTEGAIDECLRHAITKLSHLHFASTEDHARRIRQMGEEPWRVHVSGAPSLDSLRDLPLLEASELEARFDLSLNEAPLLVTYHPVTTEFDQTEAQIAELLAALEDLPNPLVFTLPNADTAGRKIITAIQAFVAGHPRARLVDNLGTQAYFSLMRLAAAMVGNSSSGLLEAPSFQLPVVNIGNRQKGRTRGANVIDTGNGREEIRRGIRQALSPDFAKGLRHSGNPYQGPEMASAVIARTLRRIPIESLIPKRFSDLGLG